MSSRGRFPENPYLSGRCPLDTMVDAKTLSDNYLESMAAEGSEAAHTAIEIWRTRVSKSPDQVAYRYRSGGPSWSSMTWREADEAAREIAGGLAALGVRRGDPVCVLAQTRVEWVLC